MAPAVQSEDGGRNSSTSTLKAKPDETQALAGPIAVAEVAVEVRPEVADGGDTESTPAAVSEQKPGESVTKQKRKVALFLAYVGSQYQGMQRNPGCSTIEGVLHTALVASGAISPENATDFSKVSWSRAARTDKGVSAVGQVVSLKLLYGSEEDTMRRLNAELPSDVRALGFRRVTAGFDARKSCDRRRYEYLLPAFAFDRTACRPAIELQAMHDSQNAANDTVPAASQPTGAADGKAAETAAVHQQSAPLPPPAATSAAESASAAHPNREDSIRQSAVEAAATIETSDRKSGTADTRTDGGSISQPAAASAPEIEPSATTTAAAIAATAAAAAPCDDKTSTESFEFTTEHRKRLNMILQQYNGTHNFHNYTVKVGGGDAQAKRYIVSCTCDAPIEILGKQWIRIVIVGQSFMMHQIRKMVGMALAEFREEAPENCLQLALDPHRTVEVPMAPALGLLLSECMYVAYNSQWASDGSRPPLDLRDWAADVDTFKKQELYSHIAKTDEAEGINEHWLKGLTDRSFRFSKWATARRVEAARPIFDGPGSRAYKNKGDAHVPPTMGPSIASGKRKATSAHAEASPVTKKMAAIVNDEWSD